jgi:hypothetical protein
MLVLVVIAWIAYASAPIFLLAGVLQEDVLFLVPALAGLILGALLDATNRIVVALEAVRDELAPASKSEAAVDEQEIVSRFQREQLTGAISERQPGDS